MALALALGACNAILGIESATVQPRGDASSPTCIGDDETCPTACEDGGPCREGEVCRSGSCQPAGDDGGMDGALNDTDGEGPDGGADGDAEPVVCTLACDSPMRCAVRDGLPTCVCGSGYDPGTDGACVDIDECKQDDRGGCSPDADCTNTEGGRVCACHEGYQDTNGDGTVCASKCALANCDPNASCSIVAGEATCQCMGAYSGDGKTCTYNPSCAALNCGANTRCELEAGSTTTYTCLCQSGFEPDPSAGPAFACKDIDDCKAVPSVCADVPNSSCENNQGGFTCPCQDGFRKNTADVCEDIPDCPAGACAGGTCVDKTSDYSCSCGAGYTATPDGKQCVDAQNDCPVGACAGGTCNDGANAYTCTCGAGYTVSEDEHSCIDNDDCAPKPCKNGGVCSDKVDDFACDCTGTGYIGKDCGTRSQGCSQVGTPCTVGRGECTNTGTYVCDAMGTSLVCNVSPKPSSTDICDGKDNDCDGSVDEDFPTKGDGCTSGVGACAAQGVKVCSKDGASLACNAVPGTPAASDADCDGVDDDCNGTADEDYASRVVTCGTGECFNSITTSCPPGGPEQATCTPKPSSVEICDGKDNDCVMGIDNGFNVGATCNNGLKGECLRQGIRVCSGGGAVCNAPSATGSAEVCDGKDNDCNGMTDEGVPATCKDEGTRYVCKVSSGQTVESACSSTTSCLNGSCVGTCRYLRDYTCMSGNSYSCQPNGTYNLFRVCNASVPERCEDRIGQAKYGQCVPNDPFVMCANGVESPSDDCTGSGTKTYLPGDVVAQPFQPTENVRLTAFGARTGTVNACNVYLSLHHDTSGQPGTLINLTGYRGLNASSLNLTAPSSATDAATKLTANTKYWLVARIGGSGSCQFLYSSTNVAAGPFRYGTATAITAPDDMSPGDTSPTSSGGQITLFIQAQR